MICLLSRFVNVVVAYYLSSGNVLQTSYWCPDQWHQYVDQLWPSCGPEFILFSISFNKTMFSSSLSLILQQFWHEVWLFNSTCCLGNIIVSQSWGDAWQLVMVNCFVRVSATPFFPWIPRLPSPQPTLLLSVGRSWCHCEHIFSSLEAAAKQSCLAIFVLGIHRKFMKSFSSISSHAITAGSSLHTAKL